MSIQKVLLLSWAAVWFSVTPGYAGQCMHDIDSAWVELGPRMQAIIGAVPQSVAGALHYQPTPNSIAAAEEKLEEKWLPWKWNTERSPANRGRT